MLEQTQLLIMIVDELKIINHGVFYIAIFNLILIILFVIFNVLKTDV